MELEIWTDGSCNNNPKHDTWGYGGWGFCVVRDGKVIFEDLGFDEKVTSQKMEMQAVIEGLKFAKDKHPNSTITIVSDSAYIINCFKERWYLRWIEIEWCDVKNKEYWTKILELYHSKLLRVKFRKVKGHSGVKMNERADLLAGEARKYIMEKNGVL
jgi:ribonuclease HI